MAEKEEKKPEAKKPATDGAKKSRKQEGISSAVQIAGAGEARTSPAHGNVRLASVYKEKVVPALMKEFQFKNSMQVPRIKSISINCAVKEAVANPKVLDSTMEEVMVISGQRPVLTRAKKAIAAFKVRKGNAVGVMVTLRRARMYEFLDRLINVALPRVRDFKGVNPKAFDGRGNYSLGIKEQIIFPEVNYDRVDKIKGLTITITTTAKNNEEARALLTHMGMPFRK